MGMPFGAVRAYTVGAAGTTVATGASSANTAIPNDASGVRARVVRVACTAACHIKPIVGTGTAATANDILVQPGDEVILNVKQFDHIAYIQDTATGNLTITPLEV